MLAFVYILFLFFFPFRFTIFLERQLLMCWKCWNGKFCTLNLLRFSSFDHCSCPSVRTRFKLYLLCRHSSQVSNFRFAEKEGTGSLESLSFNLKEDHWYLFELQRYSEAHSARLSRLHQPYSCPVDLQSRFKVWLFDGEHWTRASFVFRITANSALKHAYFRELLDARERRENGGKI